MHLDDPDNLQPVIRPGVPAEMRRAQRYTRSSSFQEWVQEGQRLAAVGSDLARKVTNWRFDVGDWILDGAEQYGEKYSERARQLMAGIGISLLQMRQYASIASRVAPSERISDLSFRHHYHVASLPSAEQRMWLKKARNQSMSSIALKNAIEGIEPETLHTKIQWVLLELGRNMGFDLWVAPNDRSKAWDGNEFEDISQLLPQLPRQFGGNEEAHKTVRRIDVLWLKRGTVVAAFEIEATTQVYSGLLRMSDLVSLVGQQLSVGLYVVAPEVKRDKVVKEINRPTFSDLKLPNICRLITFERLTGEMDHLGQRTIHMKDSFLSWVSERCDLPAGASRAEDD